MPIYEYICEDLPDAFEKMCEQTQEIACPKMRRQRRNAIQLRCSARRNWVQATGLRQAIRRVLLAEAAVVAAADAAATDCG